MISLVVATDENGAIGAENRIPWRIRTDLRRLASLTRGHPVILGRKSYESMVGYYTKTGRRMPGSHYIVLTRNADFKSPHNYVHGALSIDDALTQAANYGEDVYVIGGGSVFTAILPYANLVHLTTVHTILDVEADAHFTIPDTSQWRTVHREELPQSELDEYASTYTILERA